MSPVLILSASSTYRNLLSVKSYWKMVSRLWKLILAKEAEVIQNIFRSSVAATLKRTACDALVLVHFLKFLKWLQCLPQHPVVLRLGRDCRLWNWNTSKASCRILHACMLEVSHFCNFGAVVFFNNWGHRPLWKCNKSYAHFPRKVHIAWGFCTPLTIVEVLGILKISPFILD